MIPGLDFGTGNSLQNLGGTSGDIKGEYAFGDSFNESGDIVIGGSGTDWTPVLIVAVIVAAVVASRRFG